MTKKNPINDWKRFETVQEYIVKARELLAANFPGSITEREIILSNLLYWCQQEMGKLQNEEMK